MIKRIFGWILPLLFTIAFIFGRVVFYGPMNDSVAGQDTESYFAAAKEPFPAFRFFELGRSATVPLFYKLVNPTLDYELTLISEPFFQTEAELTTQPGTEDIIFWQTVISIFCWVALVLSICSGLRHWFSKALAALILYAFAFAPQVADWDSILLSESLSISLFVLMVALLFQMLRSLESRPRSIIFSLLFLIVATAWMFTRDTNAWFILAMAIFLLTVAIVSWVRSVNTNVPVILSAFLLAGLFLFQQATFRSSERWLLPFLNNMTANVLPYPERVEFFRERGMPVSEELLSQTGSAEYNDISQQEEFMAWAKKNGMQAYAAFLADMPLWTVLQIYDNLDGFFKENVQPFFYGKPDEKPIWGNQFGNLFHPLSASVILIDAFLLALLFFRCVANGGSAQIGLNFAFCLLLFLGGGLTMCVSFLGEARSVWRHTLTSVLTLRLVLWISLAFLMDAVQERALES